jgi:hypothetical protein
MATNKLLGKYIDIIPAIIPVDLQTATNNGDYISLKNYEGVAIVLFKAIGTAGDDPVVTVTQAQDVAGTAVKALNAIDLVYTKQGALLTAVGVWTKLTQTADTAIATDATSAELQAVWYVEIDARSLDVANGFDCIKVAVADVGTNAQLGCALYIPYGLRFQAAPENLQSGIID